MISGIVRCCFVLSVVHLSSLSFVFRILSVLSKRLYIGTLYHPEILTVLS